MLITLKKKTQANLSPTLGPTLIFERLRTGHRAGRQHCVHELEPEARADHRSNRLYTVIDASPAAGQASEIYS